MHVVQIAPDIGPGSGVAGVAHHLERELEQQGVTVTRFTMSDAHGSWIPTDRTGTAGRVWHLVRVLWFSTVGSVAARRHLRRHRDAVAVCHNDALAGDVYVNHGILQAAMRSRGRYVWRMVRNPLHLFTTLRDGRRYQSGQGPRLVVNLTHADEALLRRTYPRLRPSTTVIGNGVDPQHFRPPSAQERAEQRARLGLAEDDVVVLFIGHEFDRKGLPVLMAALPRLPERFRLLVVGGTPGMIETASGHAAELGVAGRVQFVGTVPDPRDALHAADVFALPSAYEAFPLVVLEALASGVPVVASPTGCAPDLIEDGVNGVVVPIDAEEVADAVARLAGLDRAALARAARATAEQHSWSQVAARYRVALETLRDQDVTA